MFKFPEGLGKDEGKTVIWSLFPFFYSKLESLRIWQSQWETHTHTPILSLLSNNKTMTSSKMVPINPHPAGIHAIVKSPPLKCVLELMTHF